MSMNKETSIPYDHIRPVKWENDKLKLIDQRILPSKFEYIYYDDVKKVAQAITDMVVRGAPAIGITAAYGAVLAARAHFQSDINQWRTNIVADLDYLKEARPTAVNLVWAVNRMQSVIDSIERGVDPEPILLAEADSILQKDIASNYKMGEVGASLLDANSCVLTHCNAGALATGGYGTALGVIRAGFATGKIKHVYTDETRPWLQGARLTTWEMMQEKIPVTLLADGAAAFLMKLGKVQWVIVGSDRIAANGDVANKIGTYSAAVAAHHHGIKFMVVAPTSTVDMATANGDLIPVENRGSAEVLTCGGQCTAPEGTVAWNPAFDITPAELVDVIVTEKGIVESPNAEKMIAMMTK
ncbi:MAG: S-methyl-5-thioribose-1-phosphate isomerase [Acidiferrobacterales bacterium]